MNRLYTNDTLFESGSGCETHDKFCVIIINSCHMGFPGGVSSHIKFVAEEFYYNLSSTIFLRNIRCTVLNFRELEEGQPFFFLLGGFMFSNT